MTGEQFFLFVGIDWADQTDQVCVVDRDGAQVKQRQVKRTADDLADFVDWLDRLSEHRPSGVAVAIEVTRDAVITALIERGFAVFSLNPKQLDRFRDRHSVAGAKDDRRDAYVLADSLRTDRHLFQPLRLDDPVLVQLREASRAREEFARADQRRVTNCASSCGGSRRNCSGSALPLTSPGSGTSSASSMLVGRGSGCVRPRSPGCSSSTASAAWVWRRSWPASVRAGCRPGRV